MQPEWKIATNLSQHGYDGKDAKRAAAACALQWLYMFLFECTHSENISNVCRVTRHYDRIPNSPWTVWQSSLNLLSMFHEPDDRFHHPQIISMDPLTSLPLPLALKAFQKHSETFKTHQQTVQTSDAVQQRISGTPQR